MITEYKTKEAQESAIRVITGCINAIENEKGLPDKIGTLTVDYIVKFMSEYRKLIEKDLNSTVKHPCQGCVYFKECGNTSRTVPCNGRQTKRG